MKNELIERIENLPAEKQELLKLLLKQGNQKSSSGQNTSQAQLTATEKALLPVWQDILKISTIDIHDNFFKLGGDSLAAFIDDQAGREADKQSSFSFPSIIYAPLELHDPFPLTDVQQAYWIGRSGFQFNRKRFFSPGADGLFDFTDSAGVA